MSDVRHAVEGPQSDRGQHGVVLEIPSGGSHSKDNRIDRDHRIDQSGPTTAAAKPAGANVVRPSRGPASTWAFDIIDDPTPQTLARRLRQLANAVDKSLLASSKEYRVLTSLREAKLPGSEGCEAALAEGLAQNPHYRVLMKLREAESLVFVGAESGAAGLTSGATPQ